MKLKLEVEKWKITAVFTGLALLTALFSPFTPHVTAAIVAFFSISAATLMEEGSSESQIFAEENIKYFLIVLTVFGLSIRLYRLENLSLWYDESITAIAIKSMNENLVPVLGSGKEYFRGITYTVLGSISTSLFGYTDFALRLPSAIAGTASIPLTYETGKRIVNRNTGILASVLITFSWWSIVWSRQARMYSILQLTFLSSILMIYSFVDEPNWKKGTLMTLSIILAMLSHVTAYILPLILFFYLVFVYRRRILNQKVFITSGVLAVTIIYFQSTFFSYWELVGRLGLSNGDIFGNLIKYNSWLVDEAGIIYLLGITGFTAGLKKLRGKFLYLGVSFIPVLIVYFFLIGEAASRYLYVSLPFLCLCTAYLIQDYASVLSKVTNLGYEKITFLTIIALMILGNFASGGYHPGMHAPQVDFRSAYNLVSEQSEPEDIVISGWTPPAVRYYGKPDYALAGNVYTVEKRSFNGSDEYSGSKLIHGSNELSKVIENSSETVWIVLDRRAWAGQGSEVKDIISRFEVVEEYEEIKVWRLER